MKNKYFQEYLPIGLVNKIVMLNIPTYPYLPQLKLKLLYGLNHHILVNLDILPEIVNIIRRVYLPKTGNYIYLNNRENIDNIISKEKEIVVCIQSVYINQGKKKIYKIKPSNRYITIRDILSTLGSDFVLYNSSYSILINDFISRNGYFFTANFGY